MNNFTFRPNTWDKDIFNCINIHNEYSLPEKFNINDVVIDIGAHIGSFSYACLTRGAGKIYAYEAFSENYDLAMKNLSQFGDKAIVSNNAVWRSDMGPQELTFTKSFEEWNTGGGNVWTGAGEIKIQTISLDTILYTIDNPIRMLKLDCEGSEFPILLTGGRHLHKVNTIVGEFHEFGGEYDQNIIPDHMKVSGYNKFTIGELESFLTSHGFKVSYKRSKLSTGEFCNLGNFTANR